MIYRCIGLGMATLAFSMPYLQPYFSRKAHSSLVCNNADISAGRVAVGDVVHHTFRITNQGTLPVSIARVTADCSCVVSKVDRNEIPPQEHAEVEVTINTGALAAPIDIVRRIVVWANQTGTPQPLLLTIRASVAPELSATLTSPCWSPATLENEFTFTLRVTPTLLTTHEIGSLRVSSKEPWTITRRTAVDRNAVFTVNAPLAAISEHPQPLEVEYVRQGVRKTLLVPVHLQPPKPPIALEPSMYSVAVPEGLEIADADAVRRCSQCTFVIIGPPESSLALEAISLEGMEGATLGWEQVPGPGVTCAIWLRSLPQGTGPIVGNLHIVLRTGDRVCQSIQCSAVVMMPGHE